MSELDDFVSAAGGTPAKLSPLDVEMNEFQNSPEFKKDFGDEDPVAGSELMSKQDMVDQAAVEEFSKIRSTPRQAIQDETITMSDQREARPTIAESDAPVRSEIMAAISLQRLGGVDIGVDIGVLKEIGLELGLMSAKSPQAKLLVLQEALPNNKITLGADRNTLTVTGNDGVDRDFNLNSEGFSYQDLLDIVPDLLTEAATLGMGSKIKYGTKGAKFLGTTALDFISGFTASSARQLMSSAAGSGEDFSGFEPMKEGLLNVAPGLAFEGIKKSGGLVKSGITALAGGEPASLARQGFKKVESTGVTGIDQLYRTDPDAAEGFVDLINQQAGEAEKLRRISGIQLTPAQLLLDKGTAIDAMYKRTSGLTPEMASILKEQNESIYREVGDLLMRHQKVGPGAGKAVPDRQAARDKLADISKGEESRLVTNKREIGDRMNDILSDSANQGVVVDMYPMVKGLRGMKSKRPAKREYSNEVVDSVLEAGVPEDITESVKGIVDQISKKQDKLQNIYKGKPTEMGGTFKSSAEKQAEADKILTEIDALEASIADQYKVTAWDLHERKQNLNVLATDPNKVEATRTSIQAAIANDEWGVTKMMDDIVPELKSRRAEYANASTQLDRYRESAMGGFTKDGDIEISAMGSKLFAADPQEAKIALQVIRSVNPDMYSFIVADQVRKELGMVFGKTGDVPLNFTARVKAFLDSDNLSRELLSEDVGKQEFYEALSTVAGARKASGKGLGGVGSQIDDTLGLEGATPTARAGGSVGQLLSVADSITTAITSERNKKIKNQMMMGFNALMTSDAKGIAKIRSTIKSNIANKGAIDNITAKLKTAFILSGKLELRSRANEGRGTGVITGAVEGTSNMLGFGGIPSGGIQP